MEKWKRVQMWQGNWSPGPQRDGALPTFAVEEIIEPGAYVDLSTGRIYRICAEDLNGRGPVSIPPGDPASRYVRISRNPFEISLRAREICREHGIAVNF